jgi:glycogen debranching enzyme
VAEDLVVLDGSTFFVSDSRGDVDASEAHGFFFRDVRHLSRWRLLVDGEPIRLLTSHPMTYYAARVYGTPSEVQVGKNSPIAVHRDRIVADGVHEDISVTNHSNAPRRVCVQVEYAADFQDLFEVKERAPLRGRTWTDRDGDAIVLSHECDGFARSTRLRFSARGEVGEKTVRFDLDLGPRQRWETCIDITCVADGAEVKLREGHGGMGKLHPQMPLSLDEWVADAPRVETDFDPLAHTYAQTLIDLAALRFRPQEDLEWSLPAAGLPWFMATFGRDSLITAYAALPFQSHLARAALEALARLQAKDYDDFTDAEPGKILHEIRRGKLVALGEAPHRPYYGTHDATLLFLVLLDEYERWTGDVDFVKRLEPAARAAIAWMEGPADPDHDGYLEYKTRSARGLVNQCWKDSSNSMLFADGRIAEAPIATCEIQGYAYDARRRAARLARLVWNDAALAQHLETDAAKLKERFHRDFWNEASGHFVLALDSAKAQVDSLTSNIGQLLWSGILEPARAKATAQSLMSDELFSGWGIRTMSASAAGYNPIEYHNGTVWPHDTMLIADGLRRHGYREEATRLAFAMLEAAEQFGHRLPEVFAGFSRDETCIPVAYPTASCPQAWAAAAPLLALRVLLGLEPEGDSLRVNPRLPDRMRHLRLRSVLFRGKRLDVG